MKWEKKCFCFAAAAILFAAGVRLVAGGVVRSAAKALASGETLSVIFFLETGRVVRPGSPPEKTEIPEETKPREENVTLQAEDAKLVEVKNLCGYEPQVETWISQPLSLELQGNAPRVLILHSHGTESYVNQEGYEESGYYRTRNLNYNVVSVGAELKRVLEAGGISVIHDTGLHDHPSYNDVNLL